MLPAYPVSLLQFGLFWVIAATGALAVVRASRRKDEGEAGAKRSRLSTIGIALQALAFAITGFGQIRFALPWFAPSSLICSALIALLGGSGIAIFVAAARAMGRNWSVVARTRSDHELVRSGPFAVVRHPIYLALLLYLLSFGVGFGHLAQLALAVPIYAVGTLIRVSIEEKLLRAQFGDAHTRYVREVRAFIPFLV